MWRIALVLLLFTLLYGDVVYSLLVDWLTEPNLSYGLLVPPLALWFGWYQKDEVFALPVKPQSAGLFCIAAACFLYVAGRYLGEFLTRLSLPLLITGMVWTHWGVARLRALQYPLLLLFTMVPLPALVYGAISLPLQLLVSEWAAELARMAGSVLVRDGNILQLANVSLGVEEACSGLNSLAALLVTALVLAFLVCRSTAARVGLLLLWSPIAIGVNIFRVFVTAVAADYNRDFALGLYHTFSGWLIYVLSFVLLYGAALLLNRASGPSALSQ